MQSFLELESYLTKFNIYWKLQPYLRRKTEVEDPPEGGDEIPQSGNRRRKLKNIVTKSLNVSTEENCLKPDTGSR